MASGRRDRSTGRRRARAPALVAVVATPLALAAALLWPGWLGGSASAQDGQGGVPPDRPNVVVIMTDDQTVESMRVMPETRRLIGDRGVEFTNSFVNVSICCPSRATFLTGQYSHNHGVRANRLPRGGFNKLDSTRTFPVWLQRDGYYTAHIGKYLNGYTEDDGVPPGYSDWQGSVDPFTYRFFGYVLNENGRFVTYGDRPEDYQADVYTRKAVDLIEERSNRPSPFYLKVSYLAPHNGGPTETGGRCEDHAKPAPRHAGAFAREPLPRPPSFDEEDVSDKPPQIQRLSRVDGENLETIADRYRCRIASQLAVDEGVAQIVRALRRAGELRNTLLIFTSDNGFEHGEHRIKNGKNRLYEESIRVPLLIRGPGIPRGRQVHELVSNADLAPTILAAAGARHQADRTLDGRSLLRIGARPSIWRGRELLIQSANNRSFAAIRTRRYLYAERGNGSRELYDMSADPFQLQSLHASLEHTAIRFQLARRMLRLRFCSGEDCRVTPNPNLELRHRTKRPQGRRRCARPPVRARVEGGGMKEGVTVRFKVRGRTVAVDERPPFLTRLPMRRLRRGRGKTKVRAVVDLLDGRRRTVQTKVRPCR